MCLFNSDFLQSKVQDALVIIGTEEEEKEGRDERFGESLPFPASVGVPLRDAHSH